jgi:hypothetical protein
MALQVARDVLEEMDFPQGKDKIDPATITILIEVISKVVVYIIQNCILNKKTANNPNFIQKARLNLLVHRIGRENGLDREKRDAIHNALLKKGAKATEEDITNVLAEAGKN